MSERTPDEIGRIVATPHTVGGAPRLAGTRIQTRVPWACLRFGWDMATTLAQFPALTEADVLAAVAFEQGRRWRKKRRIVVPSVAEPTVPR